MTTTLHLFGTTPAMHGFLSDSRLRLGVWSWANMRFVDGPKVYVVRVVSRIFDFDSLRGQTFDKIIIDSSLEEEFPRYASVIDKLKAQVIRFPKGFLMPSDDMLMAALGPCGK